MVAHGEVLKEIPAEDCTLGSVALGQLARRKPAGALQLKSRHLYRGEVKAHSCGTVKPAHLFFVVDGWQPEALSYHLVYAAAVRPCVYKGREFPSGDEQMKPDLDPNGRSLGDKLLG